MVRSLLANFLSDEREYIAAEESWKELWSGIRRGRGPIVRWNTPWLTTSFLNGKRFLDGDPIFSAVSEQEKRAIRVVQHEADSDELDIDFWEETFCDGEQKLAVLVIDCAMSDESMQVAAALMRSWIYTGGIQLTSDSYEVSVSAEEIVSNRGFIGGHLSEPSDFLFAEGRMDFTALASWVDQSGFVRDGTLPSLSTYRIEYATPPPIRASVGDAQIMIEFAPTLNTSVDESSIRENLFIDILVPLPLSADDLNREYAYPLQNFVSFATDHPSEFRKFELWHKPLDECFAEPLLTVVQPVYKGKSEYERLFAHSMLFTLSDVPQGFEGIITKWFQFARECPNTCSVYFSILYGTWSFLQPKFFAFCQTICLYSAERNKLEAVRREDAAISQMLSDKLTPVEVEIMKQRMGEKWFPSFRASLTALVKEHWDVFEPIAAGSAEKFVEVAQSALDETIQAPGRRKTSSEALYWLMQRLNFLMKIAMLSEVGFDSVTQRKRLSRNGHFIQLKRSS